MRFPAIIACLFIPSLYAQTGNTDGVIRCAVQVCWNGPKVDFVRIEDRRAPILPGNCVTMQLKAQMPLRIAVQQAGKTYIADSMPVISPEGGVLQIAAKDSLQLSAGITFSYESPAQKRERLARAARDSAERAAAANHEAARLAKEKQDARNYALQNLIVDVNGRKIRVSDKETGPLDWPAAVEACQRMGGGWRLPTETELRAIHQQLHKQGAGHFTETWYWTASEDGPTRAWILHMGFGNSNRNPKDHSLRLRAVRDM